jgi:magnesium-transporting ATPase (P-type)
MILKEKSPTEMLIFNSNSGMNEKYKILAEFPFDSDRKRMSLIVEYEGMIILMTKGADSIVLPRISFSSSSDVDIKIDITKSLLTFAKEGLRTLVVGQKALSRQDFEKFERDHHELKISTAPDKEERLAHFYDEYERNLAYVGSTAIEDKLQYGVPETIAKLIETQIKVWVLTGDKQETAIEIGKSCKLI